jgi:hypothetical protein
MKKLVIFLKVEDSSIEHINDLTKIISLQGVALTIVHYLNTSSYTYPGDMTVPFYPNKAQAELIMDKVKRDIEKKTEKLNKLGLESYNVYVFSSTKPKKDAVVYIQDQYVDLAVCFTPTKEGLKNLFHSSFTNYLSLHANCHVLTLRI